MLHLVYCYLQQHASQNIVKRLDFEYLTFKHGKFAYFGQLYCMRKGPKNAEIVCLSELCMVISWKLGKISFFLLFWRWLESKGLICPKGILKDL